MAVINQNLKNSPVWPTLLSALVLPGAGQIYNREILKGALLMSIFCGVILWFTKFITASLITVLPGGPEDWVKNQPAFYSAVMSMVQQQASTFMTFQLLLLLLWGYSVIDAYLTAKSLVKKEVNIV